MKEKHGRVDVLVNDAGTADTADALHQADEEFALGRRYQPDRALQDRQARCRADDPAGTPGSIVNVGSIMGLRGSSVITQTGYAASKGAIVNLTQSLAAQWAAQGIRVDALRRVGSTPR